MRGGGGDAVQGGGEGEVRGAGGGGVQPGWHMACFSATQMMEVMVICMETNI